MPEACDTLSASSPSQRRCRNAGSDIQRRTRRNARPSCSANQRRRAGQYVWWRRHPGDPLTDTIRGKQPVQNREALAWGLDEINLRLRQIMMRAYSDVRRLADEYELDARHAAHILAISRVAEATRVRGIYP